MRVITIAEHDRGTDEWIFFADFAFKEALVRPVEQAEVATMDDKPRRTSVGLDDVFELRAGVFEPGGRMLDDGFAEDLVELGSLNLEAARGVDLGGKLKEFGHILSGLAASDEYGSVREEVEIIFQLVEDFVGVIDKVGFGEDDDDSLAGFDDLSGEGLVELGMWLGSIDEESADVGFFDGSKGA